VKRIKLELSKWWKQIVAIAVIMAIILVPQEFVVYNLDMGFMLLKVLGALLLARVAKSTLDTWQSNHDQDKSVSLSRFMADEKTTNQSKGIIHATQILCITLIICAALISG